MRDVLTLIGIAALPAAFMAWTMILPTIGLLWTFGWLK